MYVDLAFSVPEVTFDFDSLRFEVLACGSSAKQNAPPKKQSATINPVVLVFMKRSNLDKTMDGKKLAAGNYLMSVVSEGKTASILVTIK